MCACRLGIPVPPEIKVELRARAIVKVPLGLRFRVPEGFCVRLCTNNEACTRGVICLSDIVETTEFMPISATVMNVSDTPVEFFCNDIICDVIVWPIRAVKLKVLGQGEFDDEWNKRMESEKKAKSKAVEAVRAAEEAASADAAM